MRVETSEGVLVVFDAATTADDRPTCSGYLAYWQPVGVEAVYVYGQVLKHPGDVAAALRALEYGLDVHLDLLADADDRVSAALARGPEVDEPTSSWGPVTTIGVVEIMGFDAEDELTRVDEPYDGGVAAVCQPCAAGIGPPRRCDSPRALAEEALSVVAGCCGDGGGGGGGGGGTPCVCCIGAVASDAEGSVSSPDGTGTVASCCMCNDGNPCTWDGCDSSCQPYHLPDTGPACGAAEPAENPPCGGRVSVMGRSEFQLKMALTLCNLAKCLHGALADDGIRLTCPQFMYQPL